MQRLQLAAVALLGALALAACGRTSDQPPERIIGEPAGAASASTDDGEIYIAFLGDSLTAGLGLQSEQAYPAKIRQLFLAEGYDYVHITNGGVSGDTTAGGLRRVHQLLNPSVRILVVALGGNDALRGLTTTETHDNVAAIIDQATDAGVRVLVAGMLAPTNLGEDYQTAFRGAFARIADEYRGRVAYVPFLLEGVAGVAELNQADGIHPNEQGAEVIAELLYPHLKRMVDQLPQAAP